MSETESAGYFQGGLPYNRFGHEPRVVIVFQGLVFENKPLTGFASRYNRGLYRVLEHDYTIYMVTRRPGLPDGYTLKDMADDYAIMITEEFGGPIHVIGLSTGGSIAQHFAADHPELLGRLVIHSSAHTLSDEAKRIQMRAARFAQQRNWRAANAEILRFVVPPNRAAPLLIWLGSLMMSLSAPKDPSDMVVTVEAEDKHAFKTRLPEITAPTLVVAGDQDACYTETLFRETAAGIPNSRLILYEGMRHPASGEKFGQDVLMFLREGSDKDYRCTTKTSS
jgi:pimeloyl-ACP methyl ester carboxylesterase